MPNWVANVIVMRAEDAKKMEEFIEEVDGEPKFDFDKIIPMPDTVYPHDCGFHENWHPADMTWEEYREKYPLGDWYKWNLANWGTKWNACRTSYEPVDEDSEYAILTFDTAWSLAMPIFNELYEKFKIEYQLYFIEESDAFFGAIPYTEDETYPEYLNDPNGENNPDKIFDFVRGETQYQYLYDNPSELIYWAMEQCNNLLTQIRYFERQKLEKTEFYVNSSTIESFKDLINGVIGYLRKDGSGEPVLPPVSDFNVNIREYYNEFPKLLAVENLGRYQDSKTYQPFSDGFYPSSRFINEISSLIRALRKRGLMLFVGYDVESCNDRIRQFAMWRALESCTKELPKLKEASVDNLLGRRILYRCILDRYDGENLLSRVKQLLSRPIEHNPDATSSISHVIDTIVAMTELYEELGDMDTTTFLNLFSVFTHTYYFHLDLNEIKSITMKDKEQLEHALHRLNVTLFKNMIHTNQPHYGAIRIH